MPPVFWMLEACGCCLVSGLINGCRLRPIISSLHHTRVFIIENLVVKNIQIQE